MTKIVKNFEVAAPPESVFALVSTPEKWPQWASWVKQAKSDGAKTHWVYEMGGMKVDSYTEITELRINSFYGFKQTKGFLKLGEISMRIEPNGKGSSVNWVVEYEPPYSYLGKVMDKLMMSKQFEQSIDESVIGLKKTFGA